MSEIPIGKKFEELAVDEELHLRGLTTDEARELFILEDANRDYIAEFLPWVNQINMVSDCHVFIDKTTDERASGESYGFGIFFKDRLVGHTSLMHLNEGEKPEIGYWVSKDVSGKGITTRVAKTVSNFGFDKLGLDEILIKVRPENIASNKVAQKIGYIIDRVEESEDGEIMNIWRKKI